ncbi:MAG: hypothetical protein ACRDT2_18950 [Natronosporangium sp.]
MERELSVRVWLGLLAVAGLALAGCTDSDPGFEPVQPSPTPIICQEHAWAYGRLTRQLEPEEFLSRVAEADLERVSAILYPEDHPRAGEFIPAEEWEEEQVSAWGVFITTPGNLPAGLGLC